MKKIIIISIIAIVFPAFALAFFQPATLTNGIERIAVFTQEQAKSLFSKGYVLETKNQAITPVTSTPVQPECCTNDVGALSNVIQQSWISINGDTTYHITAPFTDATSTAIVTFLNPFGATASSTVEMTRLNITGGATTTYTISCGASATAYASPTYAILSSGSIATSSTGLIENGIATAYNGNSTGVGGGAIQKITLVPGYPYFVCYVTVSGAATYASAFTGGNNTFAGKATVRISQTR